MPQMIYEIADRNLQKVEAGIAFHLFRSKNYMFFLTSFQRG